MATFPQQQQQHHHHHRLSPSFTDSAIDVELSESGRTEQQSEQSAHVDDAEAETETVTEDELETRLARIAQLAAAQDSFRGLDGDGRAAVERCLDGLEGQLLDPRPQITREIVKNRPVSRSAGSSNNSLTTADAGTVTPTAVPQMTTTTTLHRRKDDYHAMKKTSHDLAALLEELSTVNAELQQRRVEACHIHDLFTSKCEGMAQRIIELDHETHEL